LSAGETTFLIMRENMSKNTVNEINYCSVCLVRMSAIKTIRL